MSSASVKHPVLLSLWAGLFSVTGVGLSSPGLFILVFLGAPIIAIVTFAEVHARAEPTPLRPGWSIAYRGATALLALAGLAGVFASSGRIMSDGQTDLWRNAPIALLFLLTFLAGWRALARPSPRRAAIPAMVVHVLWLPLLIVNLITDHDPHLGHHASRVLGGSLIAILVLSAVAAVLSLVGFSSEDPSAPARARAIM